MSKDKYPQSMMLHSGLMIYVNLWDFSYMIPVFFTLSMLPYRRYCLFIYITRYESCLSKNFFELTLISTSLSIKVTSFHSNP